MLFISIKALVYKTICCVLILFFSGCKLNGTNKDKQSKENQDMTNSEKEWKLDTVDQTLPTFTDTSNTLSNDGFDYVGPKKQGLSVVAKNGKYGFINHAKKVVIDLKFEDAQAFNEGLAPVKIDGKWGYINLRGNFEIAPYLDIATPFSEGLAAVRKKYLWGYIDKNNQIIIPFEFDFAYPFDNKKAQVMKGTSWFYINTNGKTI